MIWSDTQTNKYLGGTKEASLITSGFHRAPVPCCSGFSCCSRVVLWRWDYTGCCSLPVWTAPGCIRRALGVFVRGAFSVLQDLVLLTRPSFVGHSKALCQWETENWAFTAGAAVTLVHMLSVDRHYLCLDVKPEVLLQWGRTTCCRSVQHGLVRMRSCRSSSLPAYNRSLLRAHFKAIQYTEIQKTLLVLHIFVCLHCRKPQSWASCYVKVAVSQRWSRFCSC